jgi:hypothetical protein
MARYLRETLAHLDDCSRCSSNVLYRVAARSRQDCNVVRLLRLTLCMSGAIIRFITGLVVCLAICKTGKVLRLTLNIPLGFASVGD